jgi:hypothetical protein
MKDVVDFENKESGSAEDKSTSKPQLNFPMHKLEAKPTTLQVNFMMNCTGTPGVDSLDDVDSLNLFRFSIDGGLANPECEISECCVSALDVETLTCIPISFPPKADQKRPERLTLPMKKPNIFQTKKALKTEPVQMTSGKPSDNLTPPQSLNYSYSVTIDITTGTYFV